MHYCSFATLSRPSEHRHRGWPLGPSPGAAAPWIRAANPWESPRGKRNQPGRPAERAWRRAPEALARMPRAQRRPWGTRPSRAQQRSPARLPARGSAPSGIPSGGLKTAAPPAPRGRHARRTRSGPRHVRKDIGCRPRPGRQGRPSYASSRGRPGSWSAPSSPRPPGTHGSRSGR